MELYQLVKQKESNSALSFDDTAHCEAGLLPDNKTLLPTLNAPAWDQAYAEHLLRRIERNPRDLRSHTQRVLMHHARRDAAEIFSALADLFIVLGRLGYQLRFSLLEHVSERLQPDHFQFLKQRLRTGIRTDEQLPDGSYSRLSQGGIDNYPLVRQIGGAHQPRDKRVFLMADQCIAAGDIKQACHLLEQLIEADPGNYLACEELLTLYRKHQLLSEFQASYYRFSGRSLAVPDAWQALDKHFKNLPPN